MNKEPLQKFEGPKEWFGKLEKWLSYRERKAVSRKHSEVKPKPQPLAELKWVDSKGRLLLPPMTKHKSSYRIKTDLSSDHNPKGKPASSLFISVNRSASRSRVPFHLLSP